MWRLAPWTAFSFLLLPGAGWKVNWQDHCGKGPALPWMSTEQLYPPLLGAIKVLAQAHGMGWVHRDIKPQHIFFEDNTVGIPRGISIIDWTASINTQQLMEDVAAGRCSRWAGTNGFMAPEQAALRRKLLPSSAKQVAAANTPAVDVYSLDATIYFLMTGRMAPAAGQHLSWPPLPPACWPHLAVLQQLAGACLAQPAAAAGLASAGLAGGLCCRQGRQERCRCRQALSGRHTAVLWLQPQDEG
jgi:hypothetical protein